jgi:hypothetical protein
LAFVCATFQLHPSSFRQKNYLKISLQFPVDMVLFQGGAVYVYQGTMEISSSTFESNQAIGSVSEIESCYERFLPKELSQIFAPIPGGPHATSRVVLFMLYMPMWRSMTAPSRATVPPM